MSRAFLLMTSVLFLFLHCKKEETFEPVLDVHHDFQSLVDKFESEASRRGVLIQLNNLILRFDSELPETICGQCNSLADPDRFQKEIRVNPDRCWIYPQELEALIFHELGHCVLQRPHLADTLPNGDPKSMMVEGGLSLYAPCRFVIDDPANCNNLHKRKYYIDELFDPETPVPDWADQ